MKKTTTRTKPVVVLTGYCMKCRAIKEMQAPTETRMQNGKMAATGMCITCGSKMFKILPSAKTEEI
jgi:RNase P subunit RPR2